MTTDPMPCPFCGGKPNVLGPDNPASEYWVSCKECCGGPSSMNRERAIALWNTRAALTPPRMTEVECPDCNGTGIGVRSVSCLEKCDGACGGLGKVIRQVDGALSYIARQAELNHPDFNRVAKMNAEQARALLAKLPAPATPNPNKTVCPYCYMVNDCIGLDKKEDK